MDIEEARTRATLTIEETSDLLRIGRRQTYEAARNGTIPTLKLGRRLFVPTAKLLAMLGVPESPTVQDAGDFDKNGFRPTRMTMVDARDRQLRRRADDIAHAERVPGVNPEDIIKGMIEHPNGTLTRHQVHVLLKMREYGPTESLPVVGLIAGEWTHYLFDGRHYPIANVGEWDEDDAS